MYISNDARVGFILDILICNFTEKKSIQVRWNIIYIYMYVCMYVYIYIYIYIYIHVYILYIYIYIMYSKVDRNAFLMANLIIN